jgi:hypothetical protein
MERKSVLRPVAGATTCAAAGNLASAAFSEAATLPCSLSAGPMGGNGGERRPRVTSVAKPYGLRAARSSRREEALRW